MKTSLFDDGWTVAATDEESWFGLALARPISVGAHSFEAAFEDTIEDRDSTAEHQLHIDSALIAQLRSELEKANRETEAQRRYRLEAEAAQKGANSQGGSSAPLDEPVAGAAPRVCNRHPRNCGDLLSRVSLRVCRFVAALTAVALAVTVDSWRIARRHTVGTP